MLRRRISATLGSLLFSTLIAAAPALAATITVDTLADELSANGNCSLREAMQAANTNAAVDACTAGAAGLDTVVLPAGVNPLSVTITVSDAVIVRGAGRASTTINRGATNAFNGPGVAGATLTLEDLSVVGSINTGGAQDIVVTRVDFSGVIGTMINTLNGSITITDATLSGGGVNSSGGSVTVSDTTITGGGVNTATGAIALTDTAVSGDDVNSSTGSITLTRSTVTGGGVNSSSGPLTLTDSAVMNSPSNGVGTDSGTINLTRSLVSGSDSRGITSSSGAISLVNSTVSGNDGGIYGGSSTITLDAVTVTLNDVDGEGSGIDTSSGTISMTHTIVAGHSQDCDVAATTAQYSMDSDGSCGLAGADNLSNANPLLGPLANNGGPTLTHLPQAGSPAIDSGSNGLCQAVDQRGVARPIDGNGDATATCDRGAVEAGAGRPPPPPPPSTVQPVPTLSDWALIALAAILALATAILRRRAGGS